jgi:hypothetical protein
LLSVLFDCKDTNEIMIYLAGDTAEDANTIFFTDRLFCECCGMRLRASPSNREFKEKVRAKKKTLTDRMILRLN